MAEDKETKVEEKKAIKKLDDVKDTPENKKALADADAKKVESKPAVEKVKKEKKGEVKVKVELEREYVVPLKRGVLNVPHYRRAKKAVRVLKEFMVRHMGVRDRDLKKVKIDINLNNEIWFRGIKKPMNKIKVKAKKIDGIVYVELAEIPAYVGFKIAREKKKSEAAEKAKVKAPKKAKEEVKTDEEKTEEKEDAKAGAEKAAKSEKAAAKNVQHSTKGSHAKKSMPVRKVLK
jgi:ribosomal protein L31E